MVDGEGPARDLRSGIAEEGTADAAQGEGARTAFSRVAELEARVELMSAALGAMEVRLCALESGGAPQASEPPAVSSIRPSAAPVIAEPASERAPEPAVEPEPEYQPPGLGIDLSEILPQAATVGGRLLLILGGGYLLRALTERGTLAPAMGVGLALVYATLWLFVAHYQSRSGPSFSASANGSAFAFIAFPMLAEVTARFGLLGATQGAAATGLAAAAGMFVAWQRRLRPLAWAVLGSAMFAIAGTVIQTKTPIPYLLVVIGLAVAIDWAATDRKWHPIRIAAALIANIALFGHMTIVLVQKQFVFSSTLVLLSLFAAYMLSYMARTRLEKRPLGLFERANASAVLFVGYFGAVLVARTEPGMLTFALGVTSLIAGALGYAVAYFLFVVPATNRVEAWFNTSYALVGVLVGSWLLLAEPGFAFAGIGVALAVLGVRDEHSALPLHASVCAFLAALGSGLAGLVLHAFWGSAEAAWPAVTVPALAALAVGAIALLAPPRSLTARELWPARAGKTLALTLVVAGIGGLLLTVLVDVVGGGVGPRADAGRIAAIRTAVVAASAVGLAALSRLERFREAALLVYPVLGFGALKLVVEDFPNGRALTLFAAFVLFGAASIWAPRLKRASAVPASQRARASA